MSSVEGKKYDTGKRRWSLVPWDALAQVVDVLEHGAKLHGDENWQHVRPTSRYWNACMRHLIAYQLGEQADPDTGASPLAHAICDLLFLLWFETHGGESSPTSPHTETTR